MIKNTLSKIIEKFLIIPHNVNYSNIFFSLIDDINNVIDTIYQNATIFSSTIYECYNNYVLKIPI